MTYRCESCGATLQRSQNVDSLKCDYCGTVHYLSVSPKPSQQYVSPPPAVEERDYCTDKTQTAEITPARQRSLWKCLAVIIPMLAFVISMVDYRNPQMTAGSRPSSRPASSVSAAVTPVPQETYTQVDYRDILENPKKYNRQRVRVAGFISEADKTSFRSLYFHQGIAPNSLDESFYILLEDDHYADAGQYLIVEGKFHDTYRTILSDAKVVGTGEQAKAEAKKYEDEWLVQRQKNVDSLSVVDFMTILENPEEYKDKLVRVAGTVGRTYLDNAVLQSRSTRGETMKFLYLSTMYNDIEQCVAGADVVLSGIVTVNKDGDVYIVNCNVEAIGDAATETVNQAEAMWCEQHEAQQAELVKAVSSYSFNELARYPDKLAGEQVAISGTVVANEDRYDHDRILVDMTGNGSDIICVEYTGRVSIDEPLLLSGDKVTFYGKFEGIKSYPLGGDSYDRALYVVSNYKR